MKFEQGYWFPDTETHFIEYLKNMGEYQRIPKDALDIVVRDWRQVLDIGGHVGTWARWFSRKTDDLHVFEPMDSNYECLTKNMEATSAKLYNLAISDEIKVVTLWVPDRFTNTGVASSRHEEGWREVKKDAISIDSLGLSPTVMKLDIQGGELAAITGASNTIQTHRPVICWENSYDDPNGKAISDLLDSWNYKQLFRMKEDVISIPKEYVLSAEQVASLTALHRRSAKSSLTI